MEWGNKASHYKYYVETLSTGDRVYLRRPSYLHNGFDFLICVENQNYNSVGKKQRNYPKHHDLKIDLQEKKKENPKMYLKLYNLIQKVYECHDVSDEEIANIHFFSGVANGSYFKSIQMVFY